MIRSGVNKILTGNVWKEGCGRKWSKGPVSGGLNWRLRRSVSIWWASRHRLSSYIFYPTALCQCLRWSKKNRVFLGVFSTWVHSFEYFINNFHLTFPILAKKKYFKVLHKEQELQPTKQHWIGKLNPLIIGLKILKIGISKKKINK